MMYNFVPFKNRIFSVLFFLVLTINITYAQNEITVGANNTDLYLPKLKGLNVGVIANKTSVIFKHDGYIHLVDSLLNSSINVVKVFSPEHGFRGNADAGEKIADQIDPKTDLPIVSLYGKNRKPTTEQLKNIDVLLFDIQDVGVRFYTYLATLHLVMQAAAENNIPLLVLDRPNPNGQYIDGPSMLLENTSFLGMIPIPLVYGMTIGEYALMLQGEKKWLGVNHPLDLRVIPLKNYTHNSTYSLPIKPSPNLPSDQSIALYPSLGLFEGTNVNAGRGTDYQFTRFGASFLDANHFNFTYTPYPNQGSKHPKEEGKLCYGKDLKEVEHPCQVNLSWLIEAYQNCTDKEQFFITSGFTKHAGTELLQKQIESGLSAEQIRLSWQAEIEQFKIIRNNYLLYP